jgi:hypothetical protein
MHVSFRNEATMYERRAAPYGGYSHNPAQIGREEEVLSE